MHRRHQQEKDEIRVKRQHTSGSRDSTKRPQTLSLGHPVSPQRSSQGSPLEMIEMAGSTSSFHEAEGGAISKQGEVGGNLSQQSKRERILPEDMMEIVQSLGCSNKPEKITLNQMKQLSNGLRFPPPEDPPRQSSPPKDWAKWE